jgi:hypothetical protein
VENLWDGNIHPFIGVDVFPIEVALLGTPMIKFDNYVLSHLYSTTPKIQHKIKDKKDWSYTYGKGGDR